jgi:hypothetical protein
VGVISWRLFGHSKQASAAPYPAPGVVPILVYKLAAFNCSIYLVTRKTLVFTFVHCARYRAKIN